MVGEWAQRCPDSVKALHQAGHEIMNHSATHPHLSQCSREELIEQVDRGNQMISELTGETPTLFRCPYGEYNSEIITTVRSLGMTPVQWDVDALERVGVRLCPSGQVLQGAVQGVAETVLAEALNTATELAGEEGSHTQNTKLFLRNATPQYDLTEQFIIHFAGKNKFSLFLRRERKIMRFDSACQE